MAKKAVVTHEPINIVAIDHGSVDVTILGLRPLVFNSIIQKGLKDVLLPPRTKNKQEKQASLKHDVLKEFNQSVYRTNDPKSPTLLYVPGAFFHKSMSSAAIDVPGSSSKAQMGRLTSVAPEQVAIYGVPRLWITSVRQAGIQGAPDARVRAIVPQWCCRIVVSHMLPMVQANMALRLLGAAGVICGIGDGRKQKGALDFGQFKLVDHDDKQVVEIMKNGGRAAQLEAMNAPDPVCYDDVTTDLWDFYREELSQRELLGQHPKIAKISG